MTCLLLIIFTLINITTAFILSSNSQYRTNNIYTELHTIVSMEETEQLQPSEALASSLLMDALQSIEDQKQRPTVIQQAINILNNLESQANSFSIEEPIAVVKDEKDDADTADNNDINSNISKLTYTAISTLHSLHMFVHRVHVSKYPKPSRKKKGSSGVVWKTLASLVDSSLGKENASIGSTVAVLAMGIVLSIVSFDDDTSITKMITSAVLPNGDKGSDASKREEDTSTKEEAVNTNSSHIVARAVVLELLQQYTQSANVNKTSSATVDLQIVSKIESGFAVGRKCRHHDKELSQAVDAILCNQVFGISGDTDDSDVSTTTTISKDILSPTLSLVSNIRPWQHQTMNISIEKLITIAGELDLWLSAELLCDAAIQSISSSELEPATEKKKAALATSFPNGLEAESILKDSLVLVPKQEETIAHLATGALVDCTLDYRLYRRADVFASKYYSWVGPERYSESRYLHALDTITKLVKKRQVPIIDKQIERVDSMVQRVSKDLPSTTTTSGESQDKRIREGDIAIDTMSESIREFSVRKLRASNNHAAAARLAKLWDMEYNTDPLLMQAELQKKRETYLQWNDLGCRGEAQPLPELISEPSVLLDQYKLLMGDDKNKEAEIIGFDCEWSDTIQYVALLQLSSTTKSLLLDILALTKTREGCDALKSTVGKLFSSSSGVHVIGFGCKDDIKRLRASPCVNDNHWFPQQKDLHIKDLRILIAEHSDGSQMKHFGLSRACEFFLGKQLDKAEQCSDWLARPLSPEQIEYASLDAWACAKIFTVLQQKLNRLKQISST